MSYSTHVYLHGYCSLFIIILLISSLSDSHLNSLSFHHNSLFLSSQLSLISSLSNELSYKADQLLLLFKISSLKDALSFSHLNSLWWTLLQSRSASPSSSKSQASKTKTTIWNPTIKFEECNERLIMVNYGHNQTVGFRERCSQSFVKVGQIRLNLIDGPKTTGFGERFLVGYWVLA